MCDLKFVSVFLFFFFFNDTATTEIYTLSLHDALPISASLYAVQIVLMERFAPRYDPLAFTAVEMAAAFVGFSAIAVAAGQIELPRGATVWAALLVTGIFASALAYLVQAWAQRRTSATRTALVFALEP